MSYGKAVRKLQQINQSYQERPSADIVKDLRDLVTELQRSMPPPPVIIKSPLVRTDIEKNHPLPVRWVFLFILTGNHDGKFSTELGSLPSFDQLSFMDDAVFDEKTNLLVLDFLIHATAKELVWNQYFKMMVVVKLIFRIHFDSKAFNKICDTPSQLFLFVKLSQEYIERKGIRSHVELSREDLIKKRISRFGIQSNKLDMNEAGGISPVLATSSGFREQNDEQMEWVEIDLPSNQTSTDKLKCSAPLKLEQLQIDLVKHFYEDEEKSVDSFLYFLLNSTQDERRWGISHKQLISLSKLKFTEGREGDLKFLILTYIKEGEKGFLEKVDDYLNRYPFVTDIENSSMEVVIMDSAVRKLSGSIEADIKTICENWKKYGNRNVRESIGSGKAEVFGKYLESNQEYTNEESFRYRLTLPQIPEKFLYIKEVIILFCRITVLKKKVRVTLENIGR